jgi:spore coat polysaccharide biosynthesis protein SpsF
VDEPEDFEFITQIYEALYPDNPSFTMANVLRLLEDHPELADLNAGFQRNEGMKKSLMEDKAQGYL